MSLKRSEPPEGHRAMGPVLRGDAATKAASVTTPGRRRLSRRVVLTGLGGATLGLPLLEGLGPRRAEAQNLGGDTFAIFFRQANGVACEQNTQELGQEPERFWPTELGALSEETVRGRALDELVAHLPRILAVRGVNMVNFEYGDGHARGALQGLTARGPVVPDLAGDSEADGESLDHRIGRELNPDGRDSLFLYAGAPHGWMGGPCISYRGSANRRSALNDPWDGYQTMVGGATGLSEEAVDLLARRNRSVNDLVRGQLTSLLSRKELSTRDRQRLDLHLTSVRELEGALSCQMMENEEMKLAGYEGIFASTDGDLALQTARAHMDVAALAVACGYTRSVAIQVGNGNDGLTEYRDDDGNLMENFHYVSHRRLSHGIDGSVIEGSDLLHHMVDRQFARTFKHLVDRLHSYSVGGQSLLEQGVAVWYNDLGDGPAHSATSAPVIIAGSCGGYFKQGQHVQIGELGWGAPETHASLLNSIATAVGCRTEGEEDCRDFGDPMLNREPNQDVRA